MPRAAISAVSEKLWSRQETRRAQRVGDPGGQEGVPGRVRVRIDGGDHDFAPATARAEMARAIAGWVADTL